MRLYPLSILALACVCLSCSSSRQTSPDTSADRSSSPDQTVVARYAGTSLTQAELDSAYTASVGGRASAADSSLSTYRDFLERYVNFRIKVRAAQEAGMDTLASVRRDLNNYRLKMARPRLLREVVYEPIARTLYERKAEEVDVSHIMIRPPSPSDSAAARDTLQMLVDSLQQGVPFGDLAYRHSDDPSAQREGRNGYRGRLGYIQAGQVVAPFERRMYEVQPGTVSNIFRTQYGYHVIMVHDRRPAQPTVGLAHILRRPGSDTTATRRFLDSLRAAILQDSTTFERAARQHSADRGSAAKGGRLGTVSPSDLPRPMQEAVARLDTAGSISEVVRTRFGYHLLQLTERAERGSFEDEYSELKQQITGRPRVEKRKKALTQRIRSEVGTSVDTARILKKTGLASVDSLARPLLSHPADSMDASPQIATLGDSTFTLEQLANHLSTTDGGAQMSLGALVDDFLDEKALQYASVRYAQQTPALAREMQKYREGALLFRFMQDSVWTAAAQDINGLKETFRANRDQYQLPSRVRTVILRAPADSLLHPYVDRYEQTGSIASTVRAVRGDSLVSVDTTEVTESSPEVYRPVLSQPDSAAVGPVRHRTESLLLLRDRRLPARRKTFSEARSSVVQDYQETYEQRVVRRLRERYDVTTYPERLRPASSGSSSQP